jgi:hypothetical protein
MSNKAKGCLVLLIALLAVIIIAFAMCGEGGEKLPEGLTAEEAFVAEIVGYKTNHGKGDYEVKLFDVTNHGTALDISLIGDDNLSNDFIKRGMWRDSAKLFAAVFEEYPDLDSVYIYWQFPLVDQKGNEKLGEVMRIGMYRETAESINWENFLTENFPAVADNYWQHPTFE